jgi:hypothetical protein
MPALTPEAIQRSGASANGIVHRLWLDVWGVWDTGWYLNIAQNGYTTSLSEHGGANYGFFPLFPWLMRAVGTLVGNNYIGGLIVANLAFLAGCFVFYRMVERKYDENVAHRAVKYLFLFPTAFIFSAVFSESLFLLCMVLAFYFARQDKWFRAGLFGGCAALTRSIGVIIVLPLFYEYLSLRKFSIRNLRSDILFLGLVPMGLGLFAFLNYRLTGDFLAFSHIQQTGWGHEWSNPLRVLWDSLFDGDRIHLINGLFSIGMMLILIVSIRWIGFSWWLMGMILMLFPPLAGDVCMNSMLRYAAAVFPVPIALARTRDDTAWGELLTITLALSQGFLMVFWTAGFTLIV